MGVRSMGETRPWPLWPACWNPKGRSYPYAGHRCSRAQLQWVLTLPVSPAHLPQGSMLLLNFLKDEYEWHVVGASQQAVAVEWEQVPACSASHGRSLRGFALCRAHRIRTAGNGGGWKKWGHSALREWGGGGTVRGGSHRPDGRQRGAAFLQESGR